MNSFNLSSKTPNSSSLATRPGNQAVDRPQDQSQGKPNYSDAALTPPVDVIEDSQGITLYADLPGVSRDKLNLQVTADTLTIEAESGLTVPEGLRSSHSEVSLGRYHRVFTLSKELDTGKIAADLSNGVLRLRIPKAEHAQPRRIQVQAG
ncbi:MAG TPA: Hsp20/alpha crystallin family protein [Ideonella sp.]|uniref:Hsp20/alpha crystallin family protein n=1 Tax=Ideonella sp. TaxID=1929293 RepID=UPI002BE881AE|nr:Hsp20/alpha crystallin family protein [Ideonella sp.]HSI51334.1 Hsp20/alpha crystallin family protein [Ideonella sp.]